MDLETENRIAAILLKEAAELRREAQKEGALAYLRQPTVRSRPNSRFLTATVRGVQQANRAVEISEMWRIRDKQIELDNRLRESRNRSRSTRDQGNVSESHRSKSRNCHDNGRTTSHVVSSEDRSMAGEGLRDNEIEEFLHSRTKRGRGAVGSRMDEAGPYLPSCPNSQRNGSESPDWRIKRARTILGPEKPASLKYSELSDDEQMKDKKKKMKMGSSELKNQKHKSKGKHRDGKKKKRRETKE